MANSDIFLKIDGVKGESQDSKHAGEIDVSSFSWGVSNGGAGATGGGQGAGVAAVQDIHFTQGMHVGSPVMMSKCCTGEHIPSAVLTIRKAGTDQQEYLIYTLTDVFISSYQTGASQGTEIVEQVSINFSKIEQSYAQQKTDGTLDGAVKKGWDQKTKTAS